MNRDHVVLPCSHPPAVLTLIRPCHWWCPQRSRVWVRCGPALQRQQDPHWPSLSSIVWPVAQAEEGQQRRGHKCTQLADQYMACNWQLCPENISVHHTHHTSYVPTSHTRIPHTLITQHTHMHIRKDARWYTQHTHTYVHTYLFCFYLHRATNEADDPHLLVLVLAVLQSKLK